ncbi:MAG: hypothetical protein K1000chlam2_01663 [Chlamydiae bacterium]|nr:hypothetical protein [Chlamydiota bacterium]
MDICGRNRGGICRRQWNWGAKPLEPGESHLLCSNPAPNAIGANVQWTFVGGFEAEEGEAPEAGKVYPLCIFNKFKNFISKNSVSV